MYVTSISPIYQKCLGMETEGGTGSLITDRNPDQKQRVYLSKVEGYKWNMETESIISWWNDRGPPHTKMA